ncbi:MAG: hypothetical protein LAP61_00645 [Acidobacteriia bacterium]|nr:hypothetical protein [Terriglobia bacterium]
MFHIASTLVLLILIAGILLRRRRRIHVPIMITAFGLDLASVLAIEVSRGAIKKAISAPPPLLLFHVTVSVSALVFYGVMFVLGERVRKGAEQLRPWHRRTAWLFGACRTANYITSWMI